MPELASDLSNIHLLRGERWILTDVSWQVNRGELAAILGPNGCGKSTLARIIAGYLWPTRGNVCIDGHRFGETDLNELREEIRLVQPAGPFDVDAELSARDVVLTGLHGTLALYESPSADQTTRATELLAQVGLHRVSESKYLTLSSGERMRALIARAVMIPPKLLLLDEPTAGLDLLAREQVLATIQKLHDDPSHQTTIVIITHHVEELPPATGNVLLLSNGKRVAAGAIADVLTGEHLSRAYGCQVEAELHDGRWYLRIPSRSWDDLI
jgi:iron complex transport system ATP-binding protein